MILPIYAYGHPVLKKIATEITPDFPDLKTLIADMWETMYYADGVGLAAPQIGQSIRLFVIDTLQISREDQTPSDTDRGYKQVFINAQMVLEDGNTKGYEEGCLSIPGIRGDVERPERIHIKWLDENFEPHEAIYTGFDARVIQHEYDHLQGALFTEKLKPLKKRLIQRKLEEIRQGKVRADYKMRFALR